MDDGDFTIVNVQRFVEATRASGYKSACSALAELADNSFQANAKSFDIHLEQEDRRIKKIFCVDDGHGMDQVTLRHALRFGSSTRFNDRSGLGRFGMGLPNASMSQCRRVEVYSWQQRSRIYACRLDLDEVVSGALVIQPAELRKLPSQLDPYQTSDSGTVVVWDNIDNPRAKISADALAGEIQMELGRIFRYYIQDKEDKRVIRVVYRNKKGDPLAPELQAVDPGFLLPSARWSGATEEWSDDVSVPGYKNKIRVRISLLPEAWQNLTCEKQLYDFIESRSKGFSILRADREIDTSLLGYQNHWIERWWSGEIRFHPEMDELFQLTHTKQQTKLSDECLELIKNSVKTALNATKNKIVKRGADSSRERNVQFAEHVAKHWDATIGIPKQLLEKSEATHQDEALEFSAVEEENAPQLAKRVLEISELRRNLRPPMLLGFDENPEGPPFRVREVGTFVVVIVNQRSRFNEQIFMKASGRAGARTAPIELLLLALGKAESLVRGTGVGDAAQVLLKLHEELDRVLDFYLRPLEEFREA